MASIAAIRPPDTLTRPLWLSVAFHVALVVFLMIEGFYSQRGASWGGPGGAITVGIVGNVPGIPMPRPEVVTPNRVVDESKGLYKSEPPPEVKQKPPDAVPMPKFMQAKPVPKYVTRPSKILENKTPPPTNAVPYGGGGAPAVPYTSFAMGSGAGTQAGLGFNGVGGGDFGSRFSWYVEAVQRRVSGNWLQSSIDPGVSVAPRVVVRSTFCATARSRIFRRPDRAATIRWTRRQFARSRARAHSTGCRRNIQDRGWAWSFGLIFTGDKRT